MPAKVVVTLEGAGKSSGGGIGLWMTAIVAILAALGSLAVAVFNARSSDKAASIGHQRTVEINRDDHAHATATEDRRLEQARSELAHRTSLEGEELELAALRAVHEQRVEESKLIHLYFDRLISSNSRERELALFALSEFVDESVLAVLVATDGGPSREDLSKLAASGQGDSALKAQRVLNQGWTGVEESIVRVSAGKDGGSGMANGFFVEASLVATFMMGRADDPFFVDGQGGRHPAERVAVDPKGLAMILRVKDMDGSPLALRSKPIAASDVGSIATLIQRTIPADDLVVRSGPVTKASSSQKVQVSADGHAAMRNLIELQIPVEPGASGAPVFDEEGVVIGMVVAGASGGKGPSTRLISLATSAPDLTRLVNRLTSAPAATTAPAAAAAPPRSPPAAKRRRRGGPASAT